MSIHSCRCNGCILSLWLLNRLLYQLWSGLFIVDFNRNPLFDMNFNWLTFVREKKPLFGEMYKFNVFLWCFFLEIYLKALLNVIILSLFHCISSLHVNIKKKNHNFFLKLVINALARPHKIQNFTNMPGHKQEMSIVCEIFH